MNLFLSFVMSAALSLSISFLSVAAFAAESDDAGNWVGYLRAGAGASNEGPQNCYYLGNGNGHGFRLGNECDSYAEFGYSKTIAKAPDGVRFVGHIMGVDYSPNSLYNGNVQLSQVFVSMEGLAELNGGQVWVGERYYNRPDIHEMDLQYINLNGMGAGVDNINVGKFGKLSWGIFKDNDTNTTSATNTGVSTTTGTYQSSNSAIRNDVLLRGIPLYRTGKLDVMVGYIIPQGIGGNTNAGYNATVVHHQSELWWNSDNTAGVQYGVGPGTGRGDPGTYNPAKPYAAFASSDSPCCNRQGASGSTLLGWSDNTFRVFDQMLLKPTTNFSTGVIGVYQSDTSPVYGGGAAVWTAIGIRPEYAFTEHFKLQGQIANNQINYPNGGQFENLSQYTIAPTFSLGKGYWDRPELRFFVTHAEWNSGATANLNANMNPSSSTYPNGYNIFGSSTSDTTFGVQVETWWGSNWF